MKKVLLTALCILAFTGVAEAKVENLDLIACGKCILKLPENLYKYEYFIEREAIWDEVEDEDAGTGKKFIGFKKVEDALKSAGIKDFKINSIQRDGMLYFNIVTDDVNKNFIPLILSDVEGVNRAEGLWEDELEDAIQSPAYNDCKQKAYDVALSELKSRNRVDNYDVILESGGGYYRDNTSFEVKVCLKSKALKEEK